MTRDEKPTPGRGRAQAVALRVGDPSLAESLSALLAGLPGIDLVEDEDAEIVLADAVPVGPAESGLIVLADGAAALRAIRAGADAVLARDASRDEIRLAIEAVARGFALVPLAALAALFRREDGLAGGMILPALTAREAEVLALMAEGASNKAIARRLAISAHTAKFHVASILDKLDAAGRTEAVAQAARLGLLML